MNRFESRKLSRKLLPLLVAAALAGCSALEVKQETVEQTAAARIAPESPPQRTITSFSAALRCMDTMMINYGVRDVSVLVEDIVDQTKKINAGPKDMLISAVSDMTKRSRALRLIAFGPDSNNLITFLQAAERKHPYAVVPQFDIKGSVTQLDENVIRKQTDAGIGINPYLNIGVAKDAASAILGLDLTMLNTEDMAVVPGVTSRNSVVIFKEGKGYDGDAAIKKFGINFSMSLSKVEGQSQALRNLVELAAIELFGKLTKTPYWTCLGSNQQDPEVSREIEDWYYTMSGNQSELVAYFQKQLRLRGYYWGPEDGNINPQLQEGVTLYRKALGLSAEPTIDIALFRAYLNADHAKVIAESPPPAHLAAAASNTGGERASPAPRGLALFARNHAKDFRRGELINLVAQPQRDSYVYCYLYDDSQKVQRFFPNRFNQDALIKANEQLQLPGKMSFQLVASERGVKERVACFGTDKDVMAELPPAVKGTDFENLPVASLEQVREVFAKLAGPRLSEGVFNVEVR